MVPVSASQLLKKGVYPLSRSAAATCISCAMVAIPIFRSMMAKPPSWGSMPVMRCSLSVQAAGPRRRRSVSWRDQSGGTRPLRRFHQRSHRASSAVSSWSQPSCIGIAAGSAGAARAAGCAGAMGCGEAVPSEAHRGARGASPAGMDACWAAPPVSGAAPGASSLPSAYGAGHGDLRALPCRMLEAVSVSSTEAAACTACTGSRKGVRPAPVRTVYLRVRM